MKQSQTIRSYAFPDAYLITKGKEKIAFMKRDAANFADFGITVAMMDAIENDIDTFANMPTDIETLNDKVALTSNRNTKADEMRKAMQHILICAQLKFGKNSGEYKKFGASRTTRIPFPELYIAGKTTVNAAHLYLPELMPYGLTTTFIADFESLCNEFLETIIDQELSISDRNINRENRIIMGNAIFSMLMSYTKIGITIWETTSSAKCNDYFLYQSKKKKKALPKLTDRNLSKIPSPNSEI